VKYPRSGNFWKPETASLLIKRNCLLNTPDNCEDVNKYHDESLRNSLPEAHWVVNCKEMIINLPLALSIFTKVTKDK
jgi:hypothetical protein